MKQKKWFSLVAIILCILITFPHRTDAMNVTIDVLRELAPLIARATASACMYTAASKQFSYIRNHVIHNVQLQQATSSSNPHAWQNLLLLQEANQKILNSYNTPAYEIQISSSPFLPSPLSVTLTESLAANFPSVSVENKDTQLPTTVATAQQYSTTNHRWQTQITKPLIFKEWEQENEWRLTVSSYRQKRRLYSSSVISEKQIQELEAFKQQQKETNQTIRNTLIEIVDYVADVLLACNDEDLVVRFKARYAVAKLYNSVASLFQFFSSSSELYWEKTAKSVEGLIYSLQNALLATYFSKNGTFKSIDFDENIRWYLHALAQSMQVSTRASRATLIGNPYYSSLGESEQHDILEFPLRMVEKIYNFCAAPSIKDRKKPLYTRSF